ncbi:MULTISPECIES: hypothetical protein [Bacillus cereus group]|uniref:hypothetical protein n=1 Tax=Bacillus cereus group sp. N24 TaxID=2794592 RepID=UPI0011AAC944|nr:MULTISPECIES: hypothetical protein [Bacillus cereus group]
MKYSENKMGFLMSLTLFFFLWKNLKIIKYMPALVGFISVLSIFIWQRMTFGWENLGFGALY